MADTDDNFKKLPEDGAAVAPEDADAPQKKKSKNAEKEEDPVLKAEWER